MNLTIELTPEQIINVIQQIPPQEKRTIMKKTVAFLFILICGMTVFPHTSPAQELQPRPIVQLIYFYPRDRQPQPDIDEKMDGLIKDVQAFYAQHMENHGFGRKTFVFETDAQGKAVVHHVKGQFNHANYQNDFKKAWHEAEEGFDRWNRIPLSVLDVDFKESLCGMGGGNGRTGTAAIHTGSTGCFDVQTMAHELGHAFGLHHDYREVGNWLPALGIQDPMITSFCAAEWLDVIPALNAPSRGNTGNTTVKMLTPSLVSPPNTLRLRFKVADPDGLHQVQWFTYEPWWEGQTSRALWDYEGLKGVSSSTVEFVTTAVKPENKVLILSYIDAHGNSASRGFPIDISLLRRPPEVVSIPDANLAAVLREKIGESITTHGMLILGSLSLRNRGITDLTGLEHAHNLTRLSLGAEYISGEGDVNNNAVSDFSPLSGLTQLTYLDLRDNTIVDVASLAQLTQLRTLNLNNNTIVNVAPLAQLTQLRTLSLGGNAISDVASLAQLTQLTFLYLRDNTIVDVAPLAQLTQLRTLYLENNAISDMSPLVRLDLPGTPRNSTGLYLQGNPLNYTSLHTHIPAMQAKGIEVEFAPRTYPALDIISGTGQQAAGGEVLTNPFVVAAIDARGTPMSGVSVTFTVTQGSGELSTTNAITDAKGRAETTLTLGPTPGINRVRATAAALQGSVRFVATAVEVPDPITEDVEAPQRIAEDVSDDVARVSLSPASVWPGTTGDQVTVNTNIAAGVDVRGYQIELTFDTAALRYVSSADGGYLSAGAFVVPSVVNGNRVTFWAASLQESSEGDGTLATFTFEVLTASPALPTLSDVKLTDSDANFLAVRIETETGEVGPTPLAGDVNGDGVVNLEDMTVASGRLGQTGENTADMNKDGVVDAADLLLIAAAIEAAAAAPSLHPERIAEMFTATEVRQWVSLARAEGLTGERYQRGFLLLEQLLLILTPKETVLLANYPNPFNPETWIPYQLSESADVRISIYAADGRLVRVLTLGHQDVGMYESRGRAAYWDGRNVLGEPVASGIYFYTLSAGDFTATQKLLIRK